MSNASALRHEPPCTRTGIDCEWFQTPGGEDASINCVGGDSPASGDPTGTLGQFDASVTGALPSRVIAGHGARCFTYIPIVSNYAAVCADAETGVPLYFSSVNANGVREELQAVSVAPQPPVITFPTGIPLQKKCNAGNAERTVIGAVASGRPFEISGVSDHGLRAWLRFARRCQSDLISSNWASAAPRSSMISAAISSGSGRFDESSRLSSGARRCRGWPSAAASARHLAC